MLYGEGDLGSANELKQSLIASSGGMDKGPKAQKYAASFKEQDICGCLKPKYMLRTKEVEKEGYVSKTAILRNWTSSFSYKMPSYLEAGTQVILDLCTHTGRC